MGFSGSMEVLLKIKSKKNGETPRDIDVVTVFDRPAGLKDSKRWANAMMPHAALFDPGHCKATYFCEAFYIDLGINAQQIASQSAFWFGLFLIKETLSGGKVSYAVRWVHRVFDAAADAELVRRGSDGEPDKKRLSSI